MLSGKKRSYVLLKPRVIKLIVCVITYERLMPADTQRIKYYGLIF